MEEDLRLFTLGVHPVRLTTQGLSSDLPEKDIREDEHDGVGDSDREG